MSLVCQQCKEPLQLDASLVDLAPSARDTIINALPNTTNTNQPKNVRSLSEADKLAQLPAPSSVKSAWQRARLPSSPTHHQSLPTDSFVFLQDSIIENIPSTPSQLPAAPSPQTDLDTLSSSGRTHHLRSTVRLFNLLSTRTDIDHPLCSECTGILLTSLQKQLEETRKERDGYLAFEREVKKERERETTGLSQQEAEQKISALQAEQEYAIDDLRRAERERQVLQEEMEALELEEKALASEEAAFWRSHNEHMLAVEQQNAHLATLKAAYVADSATLEKLERTNVYNDAFCIGHDGVFGTINGLRLGRISSVSVDWSEINAAWGQTLLLLYTIARKLDFTFEGYRLVPMGSFSRIERTIGDKAVYELYGSGDLHLGRLLHNRRFDFAMVSFLDCLKHLTDYITTQDPQVDFPHAIVKDKIGDVSVKLQFNQEEAWTRALRHVLLALKICLRWATNGSNG